MLYDAKIEAQCDECQDEYVEIELEYVHTSPSGNNGHYDDSNVESELEELGWEVNDENHTCPNCQ